MDAMAFSRKLTKKLPRCKQIQAPALCLFILGFNSPKYCRGTSYMTKTFCARGCEGSWTKSSSLASEELSIKPKRARTNAEALHSLQPLGKCGTERGAHFVGSDRLGLNPSSSAFSWATLDKLFNPTEQNWKQEALTHNNKVKINICDIT